MQILRFRRQYFQGLGISTGRSLEAPIQRRPGCRRKSGDGVYCLQSDEGRVCVWVDRRGEGGNHRLAQSDARFLADEGEATTAGDPVTGAASSTTGTSVQ